MSCVGIALSNQVLSSVFLGSNSLSFWRLKCDPLAQQLNWMQPSSSRGSLLLWLEMDCWDSASPVIRKSLKNNRMWEFQAYSYSRYIFLVIWEQYTECNSQTSKYIPLRSIKFIVGILLTVLWWNNKRWRDYSFTF